MITNKQVVLRIAESLTKDVGRGIARLDPEILKDLHVQIGEILKIEGKRTTVVKAMPTYPDMRGKEIIQIDGLIRHNAGVGLDEKVKICPVEVRSAKKVILSPLTISLTGRTDNAYLGKIMEGLPVMAGDKIRALLFGTTAQEFLVSKTFPDGPVVIDSQTAIEIAEEKAADTQLRDVYPMKTLADYTGRFSVFGK